MRSNSLKTIPPRLESEDYDARYASIAASILYQSPIPLHDGLPLFILNAAAFPDSNDVDYDQLLPYVLSRLPDEDHLLSGIEYEIIFFAGGQVDNIVGDKREGPGMTWYIQVYQVLSRALRKRLRHIYIVHERSWVRVLTELFSTIVSPKFRKKVTHANSLSTLAQYIQIESLLIPPVVFLHDRKVSPNIVSPVYVGPRAFGVREPLPKNKGGSCRLPRVLRETTNFLLKGDNPKVEGVFRVSAHNIQQGILREAYDRGQKFIVWKEGLVTCVDPGMPSHTLQEIEICDAYGIHSATGLIKTWYRELRDPIFPESCYMRLKGFTSNDNDRLDLQELLSVSSTTSCVPQQSRKILTMHLLPLLSIIASYKADNKMSPDNIAVCFAPAMINGNDQLEDANMTSIIRTVIGQAVEQWSKGLAKACQSKDSDFYTALKAPKDPADYEDPTPSTCVSTRQGLISHENENPPLLPPRSSSLQGTPNLIMNQSQSSIIPKRKPAPPIALPPRYSVLMSDSTATDFKATQDELIDLQNGFGDSKSSTTSYSESQRPKTAHASSIGQKSFNHVPSLAEIQSTQLRSVSVDSAKSITAPINSNILNDDDFVFKKPYPVSKPRQTSVSSVESTSSTSRIFNSSINNPKSGDIRVDSVSVNIPPYLPKPRTPSPGLMKRMMSWEKENNPDEQGIGPTQPIRPINERKQSVDYLKRLYEERANTVAILGTALSRTKSDASSTNIRL